MENVQTRDGWFGFWACGKGGCRVNSPIYDGSRGTTSSSPSAVPWKILNSSPRKIMTVLREPWTDRGDSLTEGFYGR